jgi:hypothetical protein
MKNESEEIQLEKIEPKRVAKPVPLAKQRLILEHGINVDRLISDAEKFAYEAGRAAAEIFIEANCDAPAVGEDVNTAENVLDVIYGLMEDGSIKLARANQIVCDFKKPLEHRNKQLWRKWKKAGRAK